VDSKFQTRDLCFGKARKRSLLAVKTTSATQLVNIIA